MSAWIAHVKAVQAAQGLTYKDALKAASATYTKKSLDPQRCVQLLSHPKKTATYRKQCAELLDRMCVDAAARDGLLDFDARCAKRGAHLKVVDVHDGKVCCGAVKRETSQQRAERLLRIAVKIAEVTTTKKEIAQVAKLADEVDGGRKSVLRKLFGYVHSVLSFGIRRPVTLMIMTTAIVLVGYGITSSIVADLTNSVGAWEVGERVAGASGSAASYVARTELTKAQTEQYGMLIGAATPVVRGALGATAAGAAVGAVPVSAGVVAGGAAVAAMSDARTVARVSNAAASTLSVVGEAFLNFVVYSASIE